MKLNINNYNLKIKIADTYLKKLKGLQYLKNINFGLFIPKCNAIHTFNVLDSIDILVLDNQNKIIFVKPNLKPNSIYYVLNDINKTNILELPKKTSQYFKIGQSIYFN